MFDLPGYHVEGVTFESEHWRFLHGRRRSDRAKVTIKVAVTKGDPFRLPRGTTTLDLLHRVFHEYEMGRRIEHPGVARYCDIVSLDQAAALVIEHAEGRVLKDVLPGRGLSLRDALALGASLSQALMAVHQHGVVHRGIAPEHILLPGFETVAPAEVFQHPVLTGFANATVLTRDRPAPVRPGKIQADLTYFSPEQTGRMNRIVDARSDLYSLGVLLYQALTGRPPFRSDDPFELIYGHVARRPPAPHEVKRSVPSLVSRIIMRLLAKAADDRYQSASGLHGDLDKCLSQLRNEGRISDFRLGDGDKGGTFYLSCRLFGRDEQVSSLVDAFERVEVGRSEMVLVKGASGTGKTTLVEELRRPTAGRRGHMISGRFDPYPTMFYQGFRQALGELFHGLMGEDDATIAAWRASVIEVLGNNAAVMAHFIPELGLLIGEHPLPNQFSLEERRNRFHLVFSDLIGVFSRSEHPLVISLDDLHWADQASLDLIESLLTNNSISNLLLIGVYQEDSLANQYLSLVLERLAKAGVPLVRNTLGNLSFEGTRAMIAASLKRKEASVAPLAQSIQDKTRGNPLLVTETLTYMAREGRLYFHPEMDRWTWDPKAVEDAPDNIERFMLQRVANLSLDTRWLCQFAACMGSEFAVDILAEIIAYPAVKVARDLMAALVAGVLVRLDSQEQTLDQARLSFSHRSLRDAAYSHLQPGRRSAIHFRIGRWMHRHQGLETLGDRVFLVSRHLNLGKRLIQRPGEIEKLIRLNLAAAQAARAISSSEAALGFLEQANALLDEGWWQSHFSLAFQVNREYAEMNYLGGDLERAEALVYELFAKARTDLQRAEVHRMLGEQKLARGDHKGALSEYAKGLALLGTPIALKPSWARAIFTYRRFVSRFQGKDRRQILLPEGPVNQEGLAQLLLLTGLVLAGYGLGDRKLLLLALTKRAQLAFEHGRSLESAYGIASFATLLCHHGNYDLARSLSEEIVQVVQEYPDSTLKCRVLNTCSIVTGWTAHGRDHVAMLKLTAAVGLGCGDIMYAAFAADGITYWDQETPLSELVELASSYMNLMAGARYEQVFVSLRVHQQMWLNWLGRTRDRLSLEDDHYREPEVLASLEGQHATNLALFYLTRLRVLLSYEAYDPAGEVLKRLDANSQGLQGLAFDVERCLYSFLYFAGQYRDLKRVPRLRARRRMLREYRIMRRWARFNGQNFGHLSYLMRGELQGLQGRPHAAMLSYARAIAGARDQEYPHHLALARELAGRYHHFNQQPDIAGSYLQDAYGQYLAMGASEKLRFLEGRYPAVYFQKWTETPALPAAETSNWRLASHTSLSGSLDGSSLGDSAFLDLDLASVLKSAQAISREIDLATLLERIMQIMLESVGAGMGLLVSDTADGLLLRAKADSEGEVEIYQDRLLEGESSFPVSLVRYVLRSGESLMLEDAARHGMFTGSPYIIRHRPKSVLCLPTRYKQRVTGALYLENRLVPQVFTEARLALLQILLAQASVSLENAELFEDARASAEEVRALNQALERLVAERTAELEQTQKDLIDHAHQAGMATIASTVLHNVGNILNSVVTSAEVIRSTFANSRMRGIAAANNMLRENLDGWERFLLDDPKGSKLLDYYLGLETHVKKDLGLIRDNATRLMDKIHAIKDVILSQQSYAGSGFQDEPVSIDVVIDDALTIQDSSLRKREVEVVRQYAPQLPPVPVQKVKLLHILINLIKNAVEAMEDMPRRVLTITSRYRDYGVEVSLSDSGIGIKPDHLGKIFSYGFTTKPGGHGFGLHSSANAMTEMGGQLKVFSPGEHQGAVFTLVFPFHPRPRPAEG